ncbi:pirin family protein [Flavobacterium sp. CBA20B-1]|uniref:pirin family protein n=1 Tax=unclassified Flavobacterium TaxID=196869 RepID=UPI00222525DA|nr:MULTISPECIES: pirin family protein [unclassified Flavobacterium]WCM42116.1 pirin family protein [Flavobacterium sp. CBA20B-1]
MAKYILHPSNTRGFADHGWLKSYHTFSFAGYFNPERINFGALRVLNDDFVAAGNGFGAHPHENMEIVSIPLEGKLAHKDSTGSEGVIQKGEIQFMSAGTGVTHSEMNASKTEDVKFLQIWIIPNKMNITPRYGQMEYVVNHNELKTLIQPTTAEGTLRLQQNAWFKMGKFHENQSIEVAVEDPANNGIYLFLLNGSIEVDGHSLETRDAIGISETQKIQIKTNTTSEFLIIEVPMNYN